VAIAVLNQHLTAKLSPGAAQAYSAQTILHSLFQAVNLFVAAIGREEVLTMEQV